MRQRPPPIQITQLDEDLLEQVMKGAAWAYRSWEPEKRMVVLGRGNAASKEVFEEQCTLENVPILRRRGGGGTVLLAPGNLVVSLVKQVQHQFRIQEYFRQINGYIIKALHSLGVQQIYQRGHSDLCLNDRKILGSSMYRKKHLLFYTASLMISNDLAEIDRYLKHPSKEPDYRQGRSHAEFLTTLSREYPEITVTRAKTAIDGVFTQYVEEIE
jgi:lipoate-protein ligase A